MNGMVLHRDSFLRSAQARDNRFQSFADTERWLREVRANCECQVERIPFAEMEQWHFAPDTGNLQHSSGRFFSIVGLRCTPPNGAPAWDQPIISQPEVGILGIITREFDGTRYFLMQAKMEPGNANLVQLSPTLQATFSNYSQAHKGVLPPYISYFLDPRARVINSQLQSETGTRFLRKANRNVLLDIIDDIDILPGFRWLTLYEIQRLMRLDNTVNMDARTVLSNIGFEGLVSVTDDANAFLHSLACATDAARHSLEELRAWLRAMRARLAIDTQRIALNTVRDWVRDDWSIRHASGNYFEVAGVRVKGAGREVQQWCQPLLKHEGLGLSGFLCAEIGGVLHFLMQAKPEPGIVGGVEVAPTVSLFDYRRRAAQGARAPHLERFLHAGKDSILHSSIQSEEGGRFWGLSNHVLVVQVADAEAVSLDDNFAWMTLAQLHELSQGESVINSEARTLLACLPLCGGATP
jgi:dTDP-4-dehydro-6-deoxy-alpha-D-glucopyranose 2,3-dehydratase